MEFFQFHPTGIVGIGILLSEAARGEGGTSSTTRASASWSATRRKLMELAPRDMVSRAMYQEIRAGRGIGGKDYLYLDLRHLGRKVIEEKLPDITDFARIYQGVEPLTEPVPIQPTAHYAMGGIPTDIQTRVVRDEANTVVPGLYAAGRVRLRQRPRRQPAGHELAGRPARLRPAGRAADGRGPAAVAPCPRSPADAADPARAELRRSRGRREGRVGGRDPARAGRRDDGQRRRLPRRDGPRPGPAQGARAARALRRRRHRRQRQRLQHRPARGPRARLPARLRRDDGRRPRWPGRRAAAPTPARTSRSATTRTGSAHSLAYRRRRRADPALQAGDDHPLRAEAADY